MDLMLPKAVYLSLGTSSLISDELRLAVFRLASCAVLALYAGLVLCYTLGSELAFGRLETGRDLYEAGIAYGLHFLWGFGVPIAVSAALFPHSAAAFSPCIIALALGASALRLNWEAVALRFGSVRECGSSYDRRIETFVAGPVFEGGAATEGDPPKPLVTAGPYAQMRHPGFAAHILQQTANALLVAAFFIGAGGPPVQLLAVVGVSAALAYLVFDGAARYQLYKDRSSRKIDSRRLFSRE